MPTRARASEQPGILVSALVRVRATPGAVAVFDLDSTLLDNRPRQARILREYGRAADVPQLLAAEPEHLQGWSLEAAPGLGDAAIRAHRRPLRAFWEERFFTSAYCRLDAPVPGAAAFVRAVRAAGARIAYVTGRPVGLEEGTLDALARHGFPLPDGETVWLFLKPGEALHDDAWKAIARDGVDALGPVALALDNEPAHVNAYARAWRRALAIHLDTDDSGRPIPVDPGIPSVADLSLDPALLSAGVADATARAP
jgi:hypothetical protein